MCIPPSTHLVATIKDLTDVLASAFEEATDMDEDAKEYSDTTSPPVVTNADKWTSTWWTPSRTEGERRTVGIYPRGNNIVLLYFYIYS